MKLLLFSLGLVSCLLIILFFALPAIIDDAELNSDNTSQNGSNQEQQAENTLSEQHLKSSSPREDRRVVQDSDAIRKEANSDSHHNDLNSKETRNEIADDISGKNEEAADDSKRTIPVNFTFLNGIDNKALANYPVELRCQFGKDPVIIEKFTTDENGKLTFLAPENPIALFTFIAVDYAIQQEYYNVYYDENSYIVKLFKGGTLEVKVKTADHKKVSKLTAITKFRVRKSSSFEIIQGSTKGSFYFSNLPIGPLEIYFEAPYYEKTPTYKMTISSKETAQIEIQLNPARKIFFQLNSELPVANSIFVIPITPEVDYLTYESRTEIQRNAENQYSYELPSKQVGKVMVYIKDYLPQSIVLEPNKNLYFITLEKGYQAEILVTDESDTPLNNATIIYAIDEPLEPSSDRHGAKPNRFSLYHYTSNNASFTTKTNQEGIATLKGLAEKEHIVLSVSLLNYETADNFLEFDAISQNVLHVEIPSSYSLSGKITFQSQPISNAIVMIEYGPNKIPIAETKSAKDGTYTIPDLQQRDPEENLIVKALHKDYGVAETPLPSVNKNLGQINLELKEGSVAKLHLVDEDGKALPFKKLSINHVFDLNSPMSFLTDKDGNYELKNVIQGEYNIKLNEKFYHLRSSRISIRDNEQHTLVANKMNMTPIYISRTDGLEFKGPLYVHTLTYVSFAWPVEVHRDKKGSRYVVLDKELYLKKTLIFEAEGFIPIKKGPFRNEADIPKEINLEFNIGNSFKVTVWDNETGRFLPGVTVEIFLEKTKAHVLPTNENGQVIFSHLPTDFRLRIKHRGYAIYESSFSTEVQKEAEIHLIHGGALKGRFTLKENARDARAILEPNEIQQSLDEEGKFEFRHLQPGEYTLSIRYIGSGNLVKVEKFPTKIIIENEKTVEINFDGKQE